MVTTFLTLGAVLAVFGSLLGGLCLAPLARYIGKVQNAKFLNSTLVCFIASIVYLGTWYLLGTDVISLGIVNIILINLVILSFAYVSSGKFIWNCSWKQSFYANIVWIVIYSALAGFTIAKFS